MGERIRATARRAASKGRARETGSREVRKPATQVAPVEDPADWAEPDDGTDRLAEGEMEMLLTGHAATHGIEGDDNWMLEPTRHDLD